MSTPYGGGDQNQGWQQQGQPPGPPPGGPQGWPPPGPPPGQPGQGQPPGYPPQGYPPAGYGQPDYSQVQPNYGQPFGGGGPPRLASWGKRFGAALLDGLIFGGAALAVWLVALLLGLLLSLITEALAIVAGLLGFAGYIAILVWLMLMEAGPYGQTPGKAMMGIRVINTRGQLLTKGASVGRYFAKTLSALPCYLGLLWPLWDQERRTFHDMILETRVIEVANSPSFGEIIRAPLGNRT